MKNPKYSFIHYRNILTGILPFVFFATYSQIDRSQLPKPATPKPIEIGDYQSFELSNGLKVFVVENRKLPRVSYSLIIDRPPLLEKDKIGYLSMVGQMLRRGTTHRNKEKLDEEVDFLGATLSASSKSVYASGLSKYKEKIFELMTDIFLNPTFPAEELEKIRQQTLSGLAANKEDPSAITVHLNASLVYGNNHPYGEIQTEETTNNITVDDLKTYHTKYFSPHISYLAIVGDISLNEVKKQVNKYLSNWKPIEISELTYQRPAAPMKNIIGVVDRPNAVQSVISLTYPVYLKVGSEDAIRVRVMNQILGGSFSSKLNMNLREDKGYTYGSRSSLSPDKLISSFKASAEVRNEVTDSAIVQMFYEIEQMRQGNITKEELALAKNAISGSFARSLESPRTVTSFALNTALYDLPKDYYATYLQKVQKVSLKNIVKTAQKYLNTDQVYINIVGEESIITEKLSNFAEIKYYNAYGVEVDTSSSVLPEGLSTSQIFEKYKSAIGDASAISEINNVFMKYVGEIQGQPLEYEVIKHKNSKFRNRISGNGMTFVDIIFDGETLVMKQSGNKVPLDEKTIETEKINNILFADLKLNEFGAKLTLTEAATVNDKKAYAVQAEFPKGSLITMYFGAESGLKLRVVNKVESPQGAITQIIDFDDYKSINKVMLPHSVFMQLGPQVIKMKILEIKINEPLDENMFHIGE